MDEFIFDGLRHVGKKIFSFVDEILEYTSTGIEDVDIYNRGEKEFRFYAFLPGYVDPIQKFI